MTVVKTMMQVSTIEWGFIFLYMIIHEKQIKQVQNEAINYGKH